MNDIPQWAEIITQAFQAGTSLIVAAWNATLAPMIAAAPAQLGWAIAGILFAVLVLRGKR